MNIGSDSIFVNPFKAFAKPKESEQDKFKSSFNSVNSCFNYDIDKYMIQRDDAEVKPLLKSEGKHNLYHQV